ADSLQKALDDVFGVTRSAEEAQRDLLQAVDDTAKSIKENGKTLDINTEKGRANREAVQKQAEALVDYGVSLVKSGKSNKDAADAITFGTEQLRNQLTQAGLTKDEVDD